MISLLLLVPMALVVVAQLIVMVAMPVDARRRDIRRYATAWILYAIGALGSIACVVLALLARSGPMPVPAEVIALCVTAAAVITGPLAWGRAIGEFQLSHHVVRAILVIITAVLYLWHVALYR